VRSPSTTRRRPTPTPGQRTLDDLGTPLAEVTFCVLDLETTGGDVHTCAITEVGAIKVRGGEPLGTFRTFVNPGTRIPRTITVLTGITESMVERAPSIEEVLPSLLEFLGGAVLVGHNIRFDVSFLDAALVQAGRPRLGVRTVDTAALARRLVRDEVPNCRLRTLADRFRLPHRPSHRALDDALATADLLHVLLERGAAYGVTGLDDLLALPKIDAHPQAAKLKLTAELPRQPGVYLFRGRGGQVLYVGKATDLRSRVRSYFSSDDRRKVGPMLREAHSIEHHPCSNPLEAAVLEARLIHALLPPYNRQGTRWSKAAYVRLDPSEPWPRLSVARSHRGRGVLLGPIPSAAAARSVVEAIEEVVPLRRCPVRLGAGLFPLRDSPCVPAQLGVAHCPCAGTVDAGTYRRSVDLVVRAVRHEPALLLEPLAARVAALAGAERYEEAATVRDRAAALSEAMRRARRFDALRATERIELRLPGGMEVVLERGVLRSCRGPGAGVGAPARQRAGVGAPARQRAGVGAPARQRAGVGAPARQRAGVGAPARQVELPGVGGGIGRGLVPEPPTPPPAGEALPAEAADELVAVAQFLDRHAARVRVLAVEGEWASPLPRLPTFRPTKRT
jgi:DNA polymerase-3 subunit epsilon